MRIKQSEIDEYQPKKYDGHIAHVLEAAASATIYHEELENEDNQFGYLPWKDMHEIHEWRPNELTIWAAESGIGKSLIQGFSMMHLAIHKKKCVIASFEMPIADTFERQCAAFHGKNTRTTPEEKIEFSELLDGNIFYYDFLGYITPQQVYQFVAYCAEELECKHICIDSLMMISIQGANKYDQQKDFVAQLKTMSKMYNCHIHLVCHHKKPDGDKITSRSKNSVSGASEIVNIADNVILIDEADDEYKNIVTFAFGKQRRSRKKCKKPYGLEIIDCGQVVRANKGKVSKESLKRGNYI